MQKNIIKVVETLTVNFPFQNDLVGTLALHKTIMRMEFKINMIIMSKFRDTYQISCNLGHMQKIFQLESLRRIGKDVIEEFPMCLIAKPLPLPT